jgi:hypothetical protein
MTRTMPPMRLSRQIGQNGPSKSLVIPSNRTPKLIFESRYKTLDGVGDIPPHTGRRLKKPWHSPCRGFAPARTNRGPPLGDGSQTSRNRGVAGKRRCCCPRTRRAGDPGDRRGNARGGGITVRTSEPSRLPALCGLHRYRRPLVDLRRGPSIHIVPMPRHARRHPSRHQPRR